jgi:outer membrane protein assembly factor BamB
MPTGIAIHDTDQKQGYAMNINPNRGTNRKEKRMSAITKTMSAAVLVALGLTLTTGAAKAAETPANPGTPPPLGHKDFHPSPQCPIGFRGDGSGHFPGATPPVTWNALTGEGVAWKTTLPGMSFSSAIVVGRKVFAVSSPHHLFCLDADSGQILWQKDVDPVGLLAKDRAAEVRQALAAVVQEFKTQSAPADKATRDALQKKVAALATQGAVTDGLSYGGFWSLASATPASDGARVYVQFPAGVLAAYTLDGTLVWQVPALPSGWAMGNSSPVVCQGRVLAICGARGSPTLLCVDAVTGKEQWKTTFPTADHCGSGSPAVVQAADGWKVVTPVFKLFDLATGKPWKTHAFYTAIGATPVVDGRHVFYVHGDYGCKERQLMRLDTAVAGEGEGITAWPRQSSGHITGSLLVVNGKAYLPDGAGCTPELIDLATGQVLVVPDAKKPLLRLGKVASSSGYSVLASPALAGGRIYQALDDGQVAVIEPSVPLKVVVANPGAPTHGSPFFQGSRIFLRTHDAVVCIGSK